MKIGIIGGGSVGQALAAKLIAVGHDVQLGIRNPSTAELEKPRTNASTLAEWKSATGGAVVSFSEAARHGDMLFNATGGDVALAALAMAGADNLTGKVLVDLSNPLDFSRGMPPAMLPAYTVTSLGEAVQAAFPNARVVKAFNTVSALLMTDAGQIAGDHDLLIAGNDADAKAAVVALARADFGWKSVVDLGDITGARATEHYLPLWIRMWGAVGSPLFNLRVVRA